MKQGKVKTKNVILMILIITVIAIGLVSGTYAALILTMPADMTNNVYQHTLECFDIEYDAGGSIIGTLIPSSTPSGGLFGALTLGISDNCNVIGTADLNLVIDGNSDKNGILTQTVDAHCENASTLQTLKDYSNETSCTDAGGIWVTTGTALKYAVYVDTDTNPSSVGYINAVGTTLTIYDDFDVSDVKDYNIYVWLDGSLSDNTYAHMSFSSKISAVVTQNEMES